MNQQTIPFLPEEMRIVPEDRFEWYIWRQKVLAYRTLIRAEIEHDLKLRGMVLAAAAQDYAYAMIVFGVLIEPRNVRDFMVDRNGVVRSYVRRKGWYPWIPFAFQVEVIREIEAALATEMDETGKEDIFAEKSRDMGLTWVFCFYASMDWIFGEDVLVGMYSHKEDLVDSESPKSMFFKVRAQVGVNPKVPVKCHSPGTIFHDVPVRIPEFMKPQGFDPQKHDRKLNLIHPSKTNQIMGESTTGKSGIGDRTNYNILDEVAKHKEFYNMWSNQSAVTDHRFALTSADRRQSDDAYFLAEQGRAAAKNPHLDGPRFISLPWHRHPLRDERWLKRQRARHANDPQGFAREYEIDWNAGLGDWVYPNARNIDPVHAPYEPGLGEMFVAIDPAIRDETAVLWIQWIPGRKKPYRVVEALVVKTPSADFLTPILLGFPEGHREREQYVDFSIHEVMDFTWELRRHGVKVTYYGDSYGNHKMGSNSESYYQVLQLSAETLHQKYRTATDPTNAGVLEHEIVRPEDVITVPYHEIAVIVKVDEKSRFHQRRKDDLNKQLRRLDFHNTPRVRYVLQAIQNNRYKPLEENRLVQNEPQEPAHDWTSHPTTAAEYWAVNSAIYELISEPLLDPTLAESSQYYDSASEGRYGRSAATSSAY